MKDPHSFCLRPWGFFEVLAEGPLYKVKTLVVEPGKRLSLQAHLHRDEHWVVVEGEAWVTLGEEQLFLERGQSTFIPRGCRHRLENRSESRMRIIETQVGSYLGEDDIQRFSDDYGR